MSMDRCKCGEFVDTDEFPEAYLLTPESVGKPQAEQRHQCVCSACQENMMQNLLDKDFYRLVPGHKPAMSELGKFLFDTANQMTAVQFGKVKP